MHLFLALCIGYITVTYGFDTLQETIGRQYNQMSYIPIRSSLAQFPVSSKVRCIAHCARLFSTCNIAVFNRVPIPYCVLYHEVLTLANLVPSTNAVVVDFGRNNINPACISSAGIIALSSYNLITLGDLVITTGVQNRTIVCGSLMPSSSSIFASGINASMYPSTSYSIEVNGQFQSSGTTQINAGSFGVSTNYSYAIMKMDNVTYTLNGRTVFIQQGNQGATINVDVNLTAKCTAISNDIKTLSSELAMRITTAGNNVIIPTSTNGLVMFYVNKVDDDGIAIFNITNDNVFGNSFLQDIEIVIEASISADVQLVVINLSGTSITFGQGTFSGTWLSSADTGQSHTIWNLYQATSIALSRNWMGALLAPYAAVASNIEINGVTAVKTLIINGGILNPTIAIPNCV